METQYIPCVQSVDAKGDRYARIAAVQFPRGPQGNSVLVHRITSYNRKALWDQVQAWFDGGPPTSGLINPAGAVVHRFSGKGAATWKIDTPHGPGKEEIPLNWDSFVTSNASDPNTFEYQFNSPLVTTKDTRHGPLATLPEYYRLVNQEGKKPRWIAVSPREVPVETGLADVQFSRSVETSKEPYVTPDDPQSCWKKPGPAAGPFEAHPGDGSVVTYYWYRFADQPALLNADLTDQERQALQERVEKLHRNWTKDREYLTPPKVGKLAEIDPALIVSPPPGLETGFVPIVTRQAARQ
jgi:hypothetical protein